MSIQDHTAKPLLPLLRLLHRVHILAHTWGHACQCSTCTWPPDPATSAVLDLGPSWAHACQHIPQHHSWEPWVAAGAAIPRLCHPACPGASGLYPTTLPSHSCTCYTPWGWRAKHQQRMHTSSHRSRAFLQPVLLPAARTHSCAEHSCCTNLLPPPPLQPQPSPPMLLLQ
jgi:hypothetical protein